MTACNSYCENSASNGAVNCVKVKHPLRMEAGAQCREDLNQMPAGNFGPTPLRQPSPASALFGSVSRAGVGSSGTGGCSLVCMGLGREPLAPSALTTPWCPGSRALSLSPLIAIGQSPSLFENGRNSVRKTKGPAVGPFVLCTLMRR
jgi:hypothetical protein